MTHGVFNPGGTKIIDFIIISNFLFALTEKKKQVLFVLFLLVLFCSLGFQIWIVYFAVHKPSSLSSSPYFFTHILVVPEMGKHLPTPDHKGWTLGSGAKANM